ncbi:MAG: hypothetical protein E6H06_02575 [Bacteroidetes bacterium]|nr:MAG: hypothetical protein E6H06_02575 [Bacteroidota bacterium]
MGKLACLQHIAKQAICPASSAINSLDYQKNWTNDGDSGDIHIDEAVAIFKMKSPLRTNKNDYPQ